MENKNVNLGGKPGNMGIEKNPSDSEISRFLADYAVFRGFAAEALNKREADGTVGSIKEENVLCLYKLFLAGRHANGAGGTSRFSKWNAGKMDNGSQPATERQKELIRKLVGRGRVKFEGGTSLETVTRKEASEILDRVFGKRA